MLLLNFKSFYILLFLIIISIIFIDKDLAIFIHNHGIDKIAFLQVISDILPYLVFIIAIIYIFINRPSRLFSNRFSVLLYLGFSMLLGMIFKSILKFLFARVRPMSLFEDNLYGFYYFFNASSLKVSFPDGHSMFSFPSGHTTFITMIVITMLMAYPKSKIKFLWVISAIAIITSLIALNYHFLGDCLAALALVSITSMLSLILYRVLMFVIVYKFLFKIFMKKLSKKYNIKP